MKRFLSILLASLFLFTLCMSGCPSDTPPTQYRTRYANKIQKYDFEQLLFEKALTGKVTSSTPLSASASQGGAVLCAADGIATDDYGQTLTEKEIGGETYWGFTEAPKGKSDVESHLLNVTVNIDSWLRYNESSFADVGKSLDDLGTEPNKFYYYEMEGIGKGRADLPIRQYEMLALDAEDLANGEKINDFTQYRIDEYANGEYGYNVIHIWTNEDGKVCIEAKVKTFGYPMQITPEGFNEWQESTLYPYYTYVSVTEGEAFTSLLVYDIPEEDRATYSDGLTYSTAQKYDGTHWQLYSCLGERETVFIKQYESYTLRHTYKNFVGQVKPTVSTAIYRADDGSRVLSLGENDILLSLGNFTGFSFIGGKPSAFFVNNGGVGDCTYNAPMDIYLFDENDEDMFASIADITALDGTVGSYTNLMEPDAPLQYASISESADDTMCFDAELAYGTYVDDGIGYYNRASLNEEIINGFFAALPLTYIDGADTLTLLTGIATGVHFGTLTEIAETLELTVLYLPGTSYADNIAACIACADGYDDALAVFHESEHLVYPDPADLLPLEEAVQDQESDGGNDGGGSYVAA